MPTTHRVETSHCKVAIEETGGAGMPILFIHGNSSCKEVFKKQTGGEIGSTFRCVAMDLPGHGKSDNALIPERTYTMRGYADAALQVMELLHIRSFAVVGWSLGGHIGIEMLTRSDGIRGLLISGTPPVGSDPADMASAFRPSEQMSFTGQEHLTAEEAEMYALATCGAGASYEAFLGDAVRRADGKARSIMMQAAMRGDGADQRRLVESGPIPLAIVNGDDDPIVNNAYVQSLNYESLWERKVHLLPGAGHAPFRESPDEFNSLLIRFIVSLGIP